MTADADRSAKVEQLEDAFQRFNALSQTLAQSYQDLENHVARLSQELAEARSQRLQTLVEKEQLAQRLQHLLQALPGGVVVLDAHGVVLECNPAAETWLGDALVGQVWQNVLAAVLSTAGATPHQWRLTNGRYVSFSARSLGTDAGQIVLLTDVTEMHALQALLDQHSRLAAMGEMLAGMAHQIRTPLSAAVLYASHLGGELPSAQRQKFADRLLERLRHLERQVNDMLSFARAGQYALTATELPPLLQRAVQAVEPLAAGSVHLQVEVLDDCPPLNLNAEAFLGALTNLLTNAVEALSGQAGTVTLRLSRPRSDAVRLSVIDNGPGMDASLCDKVFQPFFTTRSSGTGLGLAVVESVVRAHGGQVSCESQPGHGAAFHIDLPLIAEAWPMPSRSSD